jgi:carboxypeptidase family protein
MVAGVGLVVAAAIAWRIWLAPPEPRAHEAAPAASTPRIEEAGSPASIAAAPTAPAAPLARGPETDGIVARFRFVAADTHEPIPGLAIVLDQDVEHWPEGARLCLKPGAAPTSQRTIRTRTGADGLASFEGAIAGGARLVVDDDFRFVSLDELVTIDAGSTAPRDVTVARGALLRGRVVNESGTAIAGATVSESIHYEPDERRDASWKASFTLPAASPSSAITDASGAYALRHVVADSPRWVWARHPDFVTGRSAPIDVVAGSEVSVPDVVLETGGGIAVHVAAKDGAPVAGARVMVRDGGDFIDGPRSVGEGKTDASGAFRLLSLRPDEYSIAVSTDERPTAWVEGVKVDKDSMAERNVTLEDGVLLEGVVVDEAGRDVVGAEGLVWGQPTERKFVTGEGGRFRVVGIEAKPTAVTVRTSEHLPTFTEKRIPDGTEWRVVLRAGGRISGRVQGADGNPANEFELTVLDAEGEPRAFPGANSPSLQVHDADGRFAVPALADGSYFVLIRRGREAALSPAFAITGSKTIDDVLLVLSPALTVRGRVLAAATRAPIDGSSVIWTPLPANSTADRMGFERIGGAEPVKSASDGSYVLDGVPRQALAIDAKGPLRYAARVEPIPPTGADGVVALDLLATGGASIAGVVRDASGRPVPSARVDLVVKFRRFATARTGPDGAYTMGGIAAGRYVLGIANANAREEPGEDELHDTLWVTVRDGESVVQDLGPTAQTGCRVHGKVVADGKPAARAQVLLADAATEWPLSRLGADAARERSVRADDAGAYEIPSVPSGRWTVSADLHDGPIVAPLTIGTERERTVDLVAPSGALDVRVVDADSGEALFFMDVAVRPVVARDSQGKVVEWGPGLWTGHTAEDGRVALRHLPAGSFVLRISPSPFFERFGPLPYAIERRDVEIAESRPTSLEVALKVGLVLEGRVTDPAGRPVSGATILLFDDLERVVGGLFDKGTDDEGAFRVGGLKAAAYEARVIATGRALLRKPGVRVEAGGSRADFVLVEGGSVAITVVDASGAPVPHAKLDWIDESGHPASDDFLLYASVEAAPEKPDAWETDEAGRFGRAHVAPGRWTFVATVGARTGSVAVDVREGAAATARIELK